MPLRTAFHCETGHFIDLRGVVERLFYKLASAKRNLAIMKFACRASKYAYIMEKHFLRSFAFVHKARQYTQNRNMSHVAHKPSIFGAKNVHYTYIYIYREWEIPLNSNI